MNPLEDPDSDPFVHERSRGTNGYTPASIASLATLAALVGAAMLLANCAGPSSIVTTKTGVSSQTAALPSGWPAAGPFNRVSMKRYPAYRSAVAETFSNGGGAMDLSNHLRAANIPMMTPVEINGVFDSSSNEWQVKSMSYLYPNRTMGTIGFADNKVLVRDNAGGAFISYAWQGDDNTASLLTAKQALDRSAGRLGKGTGSYRLLAYNGNGGSRSFELQSPDKSR